MTPTPSIEETIRGFVARTVGLTEPPGDDEPLVKRGFIPSVRLLDLVGFLEDTYGIRLRPVDLVPEKIATIGRIAAVVRARLTRGQPTSS